MSAPTGDAITGAAQNAHRPGPRRMVARQLAAAECLSCGQRWPCEGSWQARAEEAEAKLAAIAEYVRSRPSWVVDPVESRLRKDSILAIVGGEGADRG